MMGLPAAKMDVKKAMYPLPPLNKNNPKNNLHFEWILYIFSIIPVSLYYYYFPQLQGDNQTIYIWDSSMWFVIEHAQVIRYILFYPL